MTCQPEFAPQLILWSLFFFSHTCIFIFVICVEICCRLETGLPARLKPFGIEVRNVKCARCGTYGHQSGDRECPLRDVIMPNEESRLKRDDPLTAILAHTESGEVSIMCNVSQYPRFSMENTY